MVHKKETVDLNIQTPVSILDFRSISGLTKRHKIPDWLRTIKHYLFSNDGKRKKTFYAVLLVSDKSPQQRDK